MRSSTEWQHKNSDKNTSGMLAVGQYSRIASQHRSIATHSLSLCRVANPATFINDSTNTFCYLHVPECLHMRGQFTVLHPDSYDRILIAGAP